MAETLRVGMYTYHRPYRKQTHSEEQLAGIRRQQSEACRRKRVTEDNARKILAGRL